MIIAIPFLTGMILGKHWIGLGIWVGIAVIFFGYVKALILCRHCPHYAEEGFLLQCHANAGLPKIPTFDPQPLSKIEKAAWLIYAAVLVFWFIPFFIYGGQWLLLAITFGAALIFIWGSATHKMQPLLQPIMPNQPRPSRSTGRILRELPNLC